MSFATHDMTVANQWAHRPDDQKFLSLSDLYENVATRAERSTEAPDQSINNLNVTVDDLGEDMRVNGQGVDGAVLTNWSFGQLARWAGAPAGYLRSLPVELAAECLNLGLMDTSRDGIVAPYLHSGGGVQQLRAMTSATYGRIMDADVVKAVLNLNEQSGGMWKVPGVLNWGELKHNPEVDVTKETTTLYASDRDVFLFLCDDLHPVEVGKLENGEPDMLFRGFYVSNSEVGSASFTVATMYMRAVCQNRILWGVEGKQELTFRHTGGAPERFIREVGRTLHGFAQQDSAALVAGVAAAKAALVPAARAEQMAWLTSKTGITQSRAGAVLNAVLAEEGHPAASVWDMAQGLTAVARRIPRQDERINLEKAAKTLLDSVTK